MPKRDLMTSSSCHVQQRSAEFLSPTNHQGKLMYNIEFWPSWFILILIFLAVNFEQQCPWLVTGSWFNNLDVNFVFGRADNVGVTNSFLVSSTCKWKFFESGNVFYWRNWSATLCRSSDSCFCSTVGHSLRFLCSVLRIYRGYWRFQESSFNLICICAC